MGIYQSGEERLEAMRTTGLIYPPYQRAEIVLAQLLPSIEAPAFGLEPGTPLITRQRVTYEGDHPMAVSTSYFHPRHKQMAPGLLRAERLPQGTLLYLTEILGVQASRSREQLWADGAQPGDLATTMLGVEPGSPLLFGCTWWSTADGELLEVGMSATRPGMRKTFERVIA